ncbi:hypothetical protein Q73_13380 [Bacillus coahuilensis m2-6]|uniref:GNAT family N-acetyltransferase n=1 Tax=Bacillus coahuilensis TaxID=408580 RepID=UPI0001850A16|nr:GNAT family N-acetyltransferase [Bacillus coahuilensis]KUP05411.1 hypothetical protein Q73_13380 [Bacillus coahuilensis m2-6]
MCSAMKVKRLSLDDFSKIKEMDTGIEDDYVVRAFENLLQRPDNFLYGLLEDERIVTVAGYSVFANRFAILGRLRTDRRYLSRAYATKLLLEIIEEMKNNPTISFIGAATNEPNVSANKVCQKLGLEQLVTFHCLTCRDFSKLQDNGPTWTPVETVNEKRIRLRSLKENALGMFPYECYYPLPLSERDLSDEYLHKMTCYENYDSSRFFFIHENQKGEFYSQVKYFWNDLFEQKGLWNTIALHVQQEQSIGWIDLSPQAFQNIKQPEIFDIQQPWRLYGTWT